MLYRPAITRAASAAREETANREAMTASPLYPPIEPYRSGRLPRADGHDLYWEEAGNPAGRPVLFLHGGPGAGCSPAHRRFFDPAHYRIVLFDQRGCGRSAPYGETRNNTTQHLIADIEALRADLGIGRWQVFGGSWGSTLALAYAQVHPERVSHLVLRGIFLGRRREIDWFLYGIKMVFPEHWRAFAEFLPSEERGDLLTAYHRRLIDPDSAVHLPAARRWSGYETACSTLLPRAAPPREPSAAASPSPAADRWALGIARLEAHYFINDVFLAEDALLAGLDRIRHIPAAIIQGRYDIVCPAANADELARAWPEARYMIVPDAGHSALEPGIQRALVAATDRFRD